MTQPPSLTRTSGGRVGFPFDEFGQGSDAKEVTQSSKRCHCYRVWSVCKSAQSRVRNAGLSRHFPNGNIAILGKRKFTSELIKMSYKHNGSIHSISPIVTLYSENTISC